MSGNRDDCGDDCAYRAKLKHDTAGVHNYVFCNTAPGSIRGWNFVRDYNAWINRD
ncbi:hypothetical protein [Desulfoscipio gibsoniae]